MRDVASNPAIKVIVLAANGPVFCSGHDLKELRANRDPKWTRELFDAAREPKELWIVPGATHEDFSRVDPQGYRRHVVGFLRRNLAR